MDAGTSGTSISLEGGLSRKFSSAQRRAWEEKRYGDLEVGVFVGLAIEADQAAQRELGRDPGKQLARYCKAYPPLQLLDAEEVFDLIQRYLDGVYDELTQERFIGYLETALLAPGDSFLDTALRLARQRPIRKTKRPYYDLFIGTAYHLQKLRLDQNIYFAPRYAAVLLSVPRSVLFDMIKRAIKNGYLLPMKPAIPRRKTREFRFNFERVTEQR